MFIARIALSAALVTIVSTAAWATNTSAPTLRDRQEAACAGDAQKLCGDSMPDVEKVSACMKAKKAEVSPGCAKMFDAK